MSMKQGIAIVLISLFLVSSVKSDENCSWNLTSKEAFGSLCEKDKCVLIEFKIVTPGDEEYTAGGNFYYQFRLKNLGDEVINDNYSVAIIPTDLITETYVPKTINIRLSKGETYIYPEDPRNHDEYTFLKEGSYLIKITSSEYTHFIYYPFFWQNSTDEANCTIGANFSYQNGREYTYSFDVVSWEKKWADRNQKLQEMVFNSTNSTNEYTKRIFDLNKEMVNSATRMENLTCWIAILTIANVVISCLLLVVTMIVIPKTKLFHLKKFLLERAKKKLRGKKTQETITEK